MSNILVGLATGDDRHRGPEYHPERPARLAAVGRGIEAAGLGSTVTRLDGRAATVAELARVHERPYLDALQQLAAAGGGDLDPDTYSTPDSWRAATEAAGMALAAVDVLDQGGASAALVGVRPPGHHATAGKAMGFCLLNNVAVAAAALAERGERVLIVDWDVHHGNGTQAIFWDDPRVLYASLHQWPAYPGTGRPSETGGPCAPGSTVNVPLPPGATGDVALAAVDEVLAPAVEGFRPTWVVISAGFDAHRDDPLADLCWSAGDFADLTVRVAAFAPSAGRVLAVLEGGYDLGALGRSAGATVAALAGAGWRPEPATNGGPGREAVAAAIRARAQARREGAWL